MFVFLLVWLPSCEWASSGIRAGMGLCTGTGSFCSLWLVVGV